MPLDDTPSTKVNVCHGHACSGRLSRYVLERAQNEAQAHHLDLQVTPCPCRDNCENGPTVVIEHNGQQTLHSHVDPPTIAKLIKQLNANR